MSLLCYNKGCGKTFQPDDNEDDSCVFHPGVPIFHDALKGWSCCKKRTTDFSEFLSIQGCSRGRHSNEKPNEPLKPDASSHKGPLQHDNGHEIIYQGPRSAEKRLRNRPSSDEAKLKLPHQVSASLAQALENLEISTTAELQQKDSLTVMHGTRCKNTGCKTFYQGPESEQEVCTHHPGAPVFHEGYKYWSCCCIKTADFNEFLEQKGCSAGTHRWIPKQDKKNVACRYDWHQTGTNVVVTIYAKTANPAFCCMEANGTVLSCHLQFENDKVFKKDFHLWGVIDAAKSSVNMVPSKVEVSLRKAEQLAWGKLEDPNFKPSPEPSDDNGAVVTGDAGEPRQPDWDIDDDDISDSDEEWAYDTAPKNNTPGEKGERERKEEEEEIQRRRRKEVEEEMKRAMEERTRVEEEKKMLTEEEGYEDMPDLE